MATPNGYFCCEGGHGCGQPGRSDETPRSRRAVDPDPENATGRDEVIHYCIWRQQDWLRNSLNMLARFHFSHEEVRGLTRSRLHEKLFTEKGVNWAHLPTHLKNGTCVYKVAHLVPSSTGIPPGRVRATWTIDRNPPVFTRDRAYIERHVNIDLNPSASQHIAS